MTAVIAAIAAAFLAAAVALFREHRLQQRRLLVAARITYDTLEVAGIGIKTAVMTDGWQPVKALSGADSLKAWDSAKGDLAGHLTWSEWRLVEHAINQLTLINTMEKREPPKEAESLLESMRAGLTMGQDALLPYCTVRLSIWRLIRRRIGGTRP